jgi:hypothetical protein
MTPQGTLAISKQTYTGCGIACPADAALVVNITAIQPTASGYLTVYPAGASRPAVSNLNLAPGQLDTNLAVVRSGPTATGLIYNASGGTVHVVVDEYGYYIHS